MGSAQMVHSMSSEEDTVEEILRILLFCLVPGSKLSNLDFEISSSNLILSFLSSPSSFLHSFISLFRFFCTLTSSSSDFFLDSSSSFLNFFTRSSSFSFTAVSSRDSCFCFLSISRVALESSQKKHSWSSSLLFRF